MSTNHHVEQQLLLATDRTREGNSLYVVLAELRLFLLMTLYMIVSGEQSGELETMPEWATVNQKWEFDTQVGLVLGLLEPTPMAMMTDVVLLIVTAIPKSMPQLNNMAEI